MSTLTDVDGERFAWRESGDRSASVLVLLHGLGGSRLSWEPQLHGLASCSRVVAWDMPGYGNSPALDAAVTFNTLRLQSATTNMSSGSLTINTAVNDSGNQAGITTINGCCASAGWPSRAVSAVTIPSTGAVRT